jgi:hypothetical protein
MGPAEVDTPALGLIPGAPMDDMVNDRAVYAFWSGEGTCSVT